MINIGIENVPLSN